ncbi:uncharacterized protein B0I36DRAFT_314451 [Microdochium trichocladiopsis]|uniref:V-snare n=1 Tax=Microdochium trichocladiopsis TaxID=1682393 RepID=A0A9P9BUM1_9PEZI|nr:uncharacterized protein B0I36DRAFT_314451 [Microdochium trichocladiopsis]KAH7037619.1 hypothetical protein B0I36DRAFT_314451 [Microdochium trichocladiopsis]
MSSKRPADEQATTSARKRRNFHNSTQRSGKNSHAAVDQTYGQRNAFGSLDEIGTTAPAADSDLDCEDDTEALAYLRLVRQEASGIPHVIVAKRAGPQPPPSASLASTTQDVDRDIYNDGTGDFRGYYHDGAYIAYPDDYTGTPGSEDEEDDSYGSQENDDEAGKGLEDVDDSSNWSGDSGQRRPHNSSVDEIRQAYFTSLTQRYLSLREIVQRQPPDSAVAALPRTHPTDVDGFNGSSSAFPQWSGRLRGTDPMPVQIAAMHKDSIIRLLRIILGGKFLRKRVELRARTSTWIWALLARLPDRGELDYQEIGWIRELGKRAVLLMIGLAEAQVLQEEYGVGGSDDENDGDVDVDELFEDDTGSETAGPDEASLGVTADSKSGPNGTADPRPQTANTDENQDDDAPMDLDDGEISDDNVEPPKDHSGLEDMKARLLAQLDDDDDDDAAVVVEPEPQSVEPSSHDDEPHGEQQDSAVNAAQMNVRATLNMILTVAGEFYGQRDLLEFRDPFGSL